MKTCKDCSMEFDKKTTKKGFSNQCDDCSQTDKTHRVIGYNDGSLNKSTSISIYKGTDPLTIKILTKKNQTVS